MDYDKGFEQGQPVDQHYNPPTGNEPDEYIEGWVDGRMEAIRIEDPEPADKFEQIFAPIVSTAQHAIRTGARLRLPSRVAVGLGTFGAK
jgi:hypothetical protein